MVLRPELLNAFAALGIPPESDQAAAAKAYKRLALIHHPDRNHGDSTATERFQQVRHLTPSLSRLLFSQRQPRRSAPPGISAKDISTTRHGATSQMRHTLIARASHTIFLLTMIFLWMKMSYEHFMSN